MVFTFTPVTLEASAQSPMAAEYSCIMCRLFKDDVITIEEHMLRKKYNFTFARQQGKRGVEI